MEKDSGSWFHHQHTDWQSPNLNLLRAPFDMGQQNTVPAYMNPCNNMVSVNGTLPVFAFPGVPHSKPSQLNEPRGWSYCLPRFRQAFAPVLNSIPREKLPASLNENFKGAGAGVSNAGSGSAQKRYLVFDQSGDQTTLIFTPGIGAPVQYLPSWSPKPPGAFDLNKGDLEIKSDTIYPLGPFLNGECNEENPKDDVRSEMHEDTEELNALLYSDDDEDCSEDDEVTSTGHSPSIMTVYDKQECFGESVEEVASSGGAIKRQKLFHGGCDVPSLMDTASSVKTYRHIEYEDDAESSCGDGTNQVSGEMGSLSGNKRSIKDRIREAVSILQSIIPNGKGKDAVVVLDEAIRYLRSLKVKAQALGLDTL